MGGGVKRLVDGGNVRSRRSDSSTDHPIKIHPMACFRYVLMTALFSETFCLILQGQNNNKLTEWLLHIFRG